MKLSMNRTSSLQSKVHSLGSLILTGFFVVAFAAQLWG
jgi:hypothetical protein